MNRGGEKKMNEFELIFNNLVSNQAESLLNEVKNRVSTYGEIKTDLITCEQSVRWLNPEHPYLLVIKEAKRQLEKEIDVITHK